VAPKLTMKFTPEIRYRVDTALDYAGHIDELLRSPEVRAGPGRGTSAPLPVAGESSVPVGGRGSWVPARRIIGGVCALDAEQSDPVHGWSSSTSLWR